MYVVVGCSECHGFWVHDGTGETAGCPGCGTRHRLDRLKMFARTDTVEAARTARGALLAARDGHDPATIPGYADLEDDVADPLVTDRDVLEAHGIDPDIVAAVEASPPSPSDRATRVERTIVSLEEPTIEEVVAAVEDVPAETVTTIVEELIHNGAVVRTDDGLRVV